MRWEICDFSDFSGCVLIGVWFDERGWVGEWMVYCAVPVEMQVSDSLLDDIGNGCSQSTAVL